MADDLLVAQYPKQQVTRDRQGSGLLAWAADVAAQAIPSEKPPEDWVRLRLVAERVPTASDSYTTRTMAYFQQHAAIVSDIRLHLSQWNDEATEGALSQQIRDVADEVMPAFSRTDTTQAQVDQWYLDNGFTEPVP
jgi:hypothetical protein